MGNKNSYSRLLSASECSSNKNGKFCVVYQDKVYTDFIHNESAIISKYYLPDRNIGFHILDDMLYVYSCEEADCSKDKRNKKEIRLSKKIYDKIIDIHKLTEQKKIKSVFVIEELRKLNNYNTFTLTV
jgi:hypothetical protein